jgi:hypothetical protein
MLGQLFQTFCQVQSHIGSEPHRFRATQVQSHTGSERHRFRSKQVQSHTALLVILLPHLCIFLPSLSHQFLCNKMIDTKSLSSIYQLSNGYNNYVNIVIIYVNIVLTNILLPDKGNVWPDFFSFLWFGCLKCC